MSKAFLAIPIALLALSTASADTTITFDPPPGGGPVFFIGGYTEGGMIFVDNGTTIQGQISADSGGIPSNGTAFLASCGLCRPTLQPESGGLFDLVGVDLGEFLFFGSGPFPITATVTGTKDDGSTVAANFTTDGVAGFESVLLDDSFTDLVSASFSTSSFFVAVAVDNITVRVGIEKPELIVSPASGTYVTSQAFDLTLIAPGADSATLVAAVLDGEDFTGELASCAVEGSLDSVPGVTFRCPLDLAVVGEGVHGFEATLEFGDGSTASDSASWEVLGSTEP